MWVKSVGISHRQHICLIDNDTRGNGSKNRLYYLRQCVTLPVTLWCSLGHRMNYRNVNMYPKRPIQFIHYQSDISGVVSLALPAALSIDCISFSHAWNLNRAFAESKKDDSGRKKTSAGLPNSADLKQWWFHNWNLFLLWRVTPAASAGSNHCKTRIIPSHH